MRSKSFQQEEELKFWKFSQHSQLYSQMGRGHTDDHRADPLSACTNEGRNHYHLAMLDTGIVPIHPEPPPNRKLQKTPGCLKLSHSPGKRCQIVNAFPYLSLSREGHQLLTSIKLKTCFRKKSRLKSYSSQCYLSCYSRGGTNCTISSVFCIKCSFLYTLVISFLPYFSVSLVSYRKVNRKLHLWSDVDYLYLEFLRKDLSKSGKDCLLT